MSFERPSLQTLINRAVSDIMTNLEGADARLRFSFERAMAIALGTLAHGVHGHTFALSKEILPTTCGLDRLKEWASLLNLTVKDASKATGLLDMTGVNTTVVPSGTQWQRNDGVIIQTTEEVTIAGGVATAAVEAVESGEAGNTDGSTTLNIVSPIAGLDSAGTVTADGLTGGADAEDKEALRARVLNELRVPPSGGGPGDYIRWALEVPGVTRAWEYPNELGAGTVVVRFAVDGEASPIPSGAKVTEVQAYIDARAPVTADVTVVAPVAANLSPTIDLLTDDTAVIRAAVEAELEAYLLRAAEPGVTLLWSQINEAISLAAGETDHVLSVPAANKTHTINQLPVLGTITWA